jgi:hypothetical protein
MGSLDEAISKLVRLREGDVFAVEKTDLFCYVSPNSHRQPVISCSLLDANKVIPRTFAFGFGEFGVAVWEWTNAAGKRRVLFVHGHRTR